jgi:heterotetrameric sarcosine oxidase gamma subunit
LIVRGDAAQVGPLLRENAGIELPSAPCTSTTADRVSVLWLGPSEWMVITLDGEEKRLLTTIETALAGIHHQTVEVSNYYTAIRVGGTCRRDMLMKLTTLDLHPRSFPEGAVKGSIFGRVPATLFRPPGEYAGGDNFELIIRWSHADYLWCLLAAAGREYGLPEQIPAGRVKLAPAR